MKKKGYEKGLKAQIEEDNIITQGKREARERAKAKAFAKMLDEGANQLNTTEKEDFLYKYISLLVALIGLLVLLSMGLLILVTYLAL